MSAQKSGSKTSPKKFGKYFLLEKIGSGGMAEIFKAVAQGAEEFQKVLVIKRILLPYSKDPSFVEMFVSEAKITAPLQHANIVSIHEFDQVGGQYFLEMDYVHGRDLQRVMSRANKLKQGIPHDLALFIVGEVCKALWYAYNAKDPYGKPLQIIHRDVSPSNVMISYSGEVKVTDFGVAKAATSRDSQEGVLKGKLGYMSPEQVLGRDVDHRSDLFSLGIILFECLTLKRLFLGRTDLQTLINVRDADLERRLARHSEIGEPVADILRKALDRDPDKRYETATDLLSDIQDHLYMTGKRVGADDLAKVMRELFSEESEADILPLDEAELSEVRRGWAEVDSKKKKTPTKRRKKAKTDPRKKTSAKKMAKLRETGPAKRTEEKDSSTEIELEDKADKRKKTRTTRLSPKRTSFQLKDAEGGIFGPVSFDNFLSLLKCRAVSEEELCSVNEGPWIKVSEVAGVEEHLKKSKREYSGMGLLFEGTIERKELIHLVFDMCVNKGFTGALLFKKGAVQKEVFFRDGRPRLIFSNIRHELLGEFLVQRGLVTREQVDKAMLEGRDVGYRLGDAVVAQGLVQAHVLAQLQLEQFSDRFLDLFKWERGWFGVFERAEPPLETVSYDLDPMPVFAQASRTVLSTEEIESYLASYSGMKLTRVSNSKASVKDLRLQPRETRIVNMIESNPTVDGLASAAPGISKETVVRVIFLLIQTEIYKFKSR